MLEQHEMSTACKYIILDKYISIYLLFIYVMNHKYVYIYKNHLYLCISFKTFIRGLRNMTMSADLET